jgi:hypothetical protein
MFFSTPISIKSYYISNICPHSHRGRTTVKRKATDSNLAAAFLPQEEGILHPLILTQVRLMGLSKLRGLYFPILIYIPIYILNFILILS